MEAVECPKCLIILINVRKDVSMEYHRKCVRCHNRYIVRVSKNGHITIEVER